MGAEIFDVEIRIGDVGIYYATKVSSSKNKDSSTTLTFNGDVTTRGANTGGTISIEGLYFPTDVSEAIELEETLNNTFINKVVCSGTSYTANGDAYRRTIIGTGVTVTSDDDEWSPSDGISQTIELAANQLIRTAEEI